MKQTKFRPHWLLDNNVKIYADEAYDFRGNVYNFYDNVKWSPPQYKNKESDFGMLFSDGSYLWVRWIGEEND